jgi:hypothetical protein
MVQDNQIPNKKDLMQRMLKMKERMVSEREEINKFKYSNNGRKLRDNSGIPLNNPT